jgi:hypothetical protein
VAGIQEWMYALLLALTVAVQAPETIMQVVTEAVGD